MDFATLAMVLWQWHFQMVQHLKTSQRYFPEQHHIQRQLTSVARYPSLFYTMCLWRGLQNTSSWRHSGVLLRLIYMQVLKCTPRTPLCQAGKNWLVFMNSWMWVSPYHIAYHLSQMSLVQAYIRAKNADDLDGKSWDFPKIHALQHIFEDIVAKGATCNYNSKPNESLNWPLKKIYTHQFQRCCWAGRPGLYTVISLAYCVTDPQYWPLGVPGYLYACKAWQTWLHECGTGSRRIRCGGTDRCLTDHDNSVRGIIRWIISLLPPWFSRKGWETPFRSHRGHQSLSLQSSAHVGSIHKQIPHQGWEVLPSTEWAYSECVCSSLACGKPT